MSTSSALYEAPANVRAVAVDAAPVSIRGRALDYLELTKPRIAVLELVTVAVAGCVASWNAPDAVLLLHALVGTAFVAASASAWNQWLERDIDLFMERTRHRPLPAGRLSSREVLGFGSILGVAGIAYLAVLVNPLTALLGLATWVLYVVLYTPLKTRTPFNTVVGAVAGALPALMGWVAVGGHLDLAAATLFLIMFLWQFPHFMAIAWIYRHQYAAAGMQMLPVVDPTGRRAGRQAIGAALVLVPVSLLPSVVSFAGPAYFGFALLLGLAQFAAAMAFACYRNEFTARMLLRASLIYLPSLLFMLLLGPFV